MVNLFYKSWLRALLLILFTGWGFSAQAQSTNIAPSATATADGTGGGGCRTGPCSTLNDQNYGSCGSQQMWISTATPPSSTIGADYIQFDWSGQKIFNSITIHHAQSTGRFLTGGLIQYWDGSQWVSHHTFSNLTMQCVNTINFTPITASRFRITQFQMTGSGQLSNPNFREIEIWEAPPQVPIDITIAGLLNPQGQCGLTNNEDVEITVFNYGIDSIPAGDTIPLAYQVNGGNVYRDTLILAAEFKSLTGQGFTFDQPFDFSAGGTYNVKAWVEWYKDTLQIDDTLETSIFNPLISSFPYTVTFDNFSGSNLFGWTQATYDDGNWTLNSGGTSSGATGPTGDHTSGSGQYFYTETSGFYNQEAVLESPCIDLDQGTFMFMEFWYHMHGATMGDLYIDVYSNGTWTNEFMLSGQQHPNQNDPWKRAVIDLSQYTGIAQVRFRAQTGSSFTSDMAIDDVMFYDTCASVVGGAPNLNFAQPDTVYVNSPADFNNAFPPTQLSRHKWYVNGTYVSDDFHLTGAIFTSTGQNDVKLVSTTCYGLDSITKTITVVNPTRKPEASFISNKNTVDVFEEVQFTDLSTFGATDWQWYVTPATYQSQFGPLPTYGFAGTSTANSQNPVIFFEDPGVYEICMVAGNSIGSDTICRTAYITVRGTHLMCIFPFESDLMSGTLYDDGGPTANYSDNQNCNFLIAPCASTVTLTFNQFDLETDWDYLRVYDGTDNTGTPLWDAANFPDGMTGNITNASVTTSMTAQSGKIYVEFESDGNTTTPGFAAVWSSTPSSATPPVADFAMPDTICVGIPVNFENISSGIENDYLWDMDSDGFPEAATEDITYTFPFTGNYDVTLYAENCGGMDSMTKSITVIAPSHAPNTDFTADIRRPNIGEVVNFFDATTYCVEDWRWEITPASYTFVGGNATSQNPQVVFNQPGYYDVKLVTSNNAGADSVVKQQFILAIQYCTPAIVNLNTDLGISRFVLGDIDNSSSIGDAGYTDYTAALSTELEKGASYVVTLERNTANNPMNRKVWIDYNQDGDFDDAGELVASQSSSFSLSWTDTFTIPASAVNGATRLRVGTSFGSLSNDPCGPNSYGEYEDYRVILRPDVSAPEITILGSDTIILEQCRSYTDAGATAMDNVDGNLTSQITVSGLPVDSCTIGMHSVTYTVTDAQGNIGMAVRIVNVIADTTNPVITLIGNNPDTSRVHTSWTEPGYSATDNVGGNLTSSVIVSGNVDTAVVGTYTITYSVEDAEGNRTVVTRTVVVADDMAPVVTLTGSDTMYVEVGDPFTDPGATVTDDYDANPVLTVTGTVDVNTVGTYILTYCSQDQSGNTTCIDRVVIVQDTEAPVVTLIGANPFIVDVYSNVNVPGVNVNDNYYNNFTITTSGTWDGTADSLGDFTIVYTVTDGSGNVTTVTRTVRVVDRVEPTISLNGAPIVYLRRWETWVDPWVSTGDNYDTNPTVDTTTNFSGTLLEGLYFIDYWATDQSGNTSRTVTRIIVVEENVSVGNNPEISVKIYPNPNRGQFVVELETQNTAQVKLAVTDMMGREIKTIHDGNTNGGKFEVDLPQAKQGIYFIKVNSGEQTFIKKVVITR